MDQNPPKLKAKTFAQIMIEMENDPAAPACINPKMTPLWAYSNKNGVRSSVNMCNYCRGWHYPEAYPEHLEARKEAAHTGVYTYRSDIVWS